MAEKTFLPMLADNKFNLTEHGDRLRFPAMMSPKLDGVRVILHPYLGAVTRSLKPIANHYIRNTLTAAMTKHSLQWFDGEVFVGDVTSDDVCRNTVSAINSFDKELDFEFHVFDQVCDNNSFFSRFHNLQEAFNVANLPDFIKLVPHKSINHMGELRDFNAKCLADGYEGAMWRDPKAPYKFGRSTLNQQWLLKI
ncbi:MAG: hypothetical protein KUG67_03405 [Proteobacteria bacterium]|nr:hypothetical protein [Pseudomonadota bacterium]